jgi:hypothetical protein
MLMALALPFAVVCMIMFLGDFVSQKSRGKIPSLLIIAVCFLLGYWTVMPRDILDVTHINQIKNITMLLVLLQVGAMFNLKQLKDEWKAVVVTLFAIAGIVVVAGIGGTLLFGKDMAMVGIPPLTGGGMATIIMSDAASAMGLDKLAMTATIIYIMQGFVGFPLTNYFLRKEGIRLVREYRENTPARAEAGEAHREGSREKGKKTLNDLVPERFKGTSYYFAKLSILALLVYTVDLFTGKYFNVSIVMIAAGILAGHYGLIEKEPLKKANSFGILMMALTASFMRYFAQSTPAQVARLIVPVVSFLVLGTVGIMAFSVPVGKKFGYSLDLSIAIGLNCFLGFPHNFVITNEVVNMLGQTDGEKEHLNKILMSKMIIGSIVSVSVVSALVAGMLVPFLG